MYPFNNRAEKRQILSFLWTKGASALSLPAKLRATFAIVFATPAQLAPAQSNQRTVKQAIADGYEPFNA